MHLMWGDTIEAFIKLNPGFRPALTSIKANTGTKAITKTKAPIILIGAGTGIGPLVGFIRHNTAHNTAHRPMYLYWGVAVVQNQTSFTNLN